MLQVISALKGFAIDATDRRVGIIVDILFDDGSWNVRSLVVDRGSWLKGRKVLIHPSTVSYAGREDEQFEVRLVPAFISVFGFLWRNPRKAVKAAAVHRGAVQPWGSAPEPRNDAMAEAVVEFLGSDPVAP